MGLISVRLDDADEAFLRKNRLSLSEVVRQAVHARVRQMQALEALEFLESVQWKPDEPSQATIRRLRDARTVRS
jgi:hypothetical protein